MKRWGMSIGLLLLLSGVQVFAAPELQDPYTIEMMKLKKAAARAAEQPVKNRASPLTTLAVSVKGTFWRNPEWAKMLNLSTDQQKKMDEIFQQHRLKLIDLTAALQKEELILEPLFGATRPSSEDEASILTQIERIADARAELEKTNSRMLLGILQVLTPEQWNKLPAASKEGMKALAKPVWKKE